jgi:hypothetical protein
MYADFFFFDIETALIYLSDCNLRYLPAPFSSRNSFLCQA